MHDYDAVANRLQELRAQVAQLRQAQDFAFVQIRDEFVALSKALNIAPPVVHPARLDVQPRKETYISLRGSGFYIAAKVHGTLDLHVEYAIPLVHTKTSLPLVEAGDIITAGQIRSALGAMMTTVFASEEYLAWTLVHGEEVA